MKKSILDPSFQYTPSHATDLRKTFARIRREQRKQQRDAEASSSKVARIDEARQAALRG